MTDFNFTATGIGSVPFVDVHGTCLDILETVPYAPFWPQFVRMSHLEDMIIQYTEGMPLLEVVEEKRSVRISSPDNREAELAEFYDHFLSEDTDFFSITRNHASGLYELIALLDGRKTQKDSFIKGQTVGPLTFGASITDTDGKMVLYNPELMEAMVRGLAIKALWQIRQLEKIESKTIIFIDEPYLSGFGSAFSPIQRNEVIDILKTVIDYLRENSRVLIGIHCCGNTDWSMLLEAGPDIINFDAFGYMDHFFLYPEDIARFVKAGGAIAWGIVPTSAFTGRETADSLYNSLAGGIDRMSRFGIERELIAKRSIITPACGMGTMNPDSAIRSMTILSELSNRFKNEFVE